MKANILVIVCAAALAVPLPVLAGPGKGGAPKVKPAGGAAVHAGGGQAKGAVKTAGGSKAAKAGGGPGSRTAKAGASGGAGTSAATKSRVRSGDATASTGSRATGATTTAPNGNGSGTSAPLTPVQLKLQRNTQLASRLQSRLPAGTDVTAAAAGFRNLGQFVAAVNVSNNLGLDFPTLKTAMVTDGKSLGQAIQAQKGTTVDASQAATQAQRDADAMISPAEKPAHGARPTKGRP